MNKENVKNVIILKNLPSNLIDEAIMVVKDKKKVKNIDTSNLIKDGGENFSAFNYKQEKNRAIQGFMKEEDLKNIEKIKKEDRKYIIKEAELVVTNYISKIEKPFSERKVKKLETSYKKVRTINYLLGISTLVSILFAIFFK